MKKEKKAEIPPRNNEKCLLCNCHYQGSCYRLASGPRALEDIALCPQDNWQSDEYTGISKSKFPYCKELCSGCIHDIDNEVKHCDECQYGIVIPKDISAGPCPYKNKEIGNIYREAKKLRCYGTEPRISEELVPILINAVNNRDDTYFHYWLEHKEFTHPNPYLTKESLINFRIGRGWYHTSSNLDTMVAEIVMQTGNSVYTFLKMPVNYAEKNDWESSKPVLKLQYRVEGQKEQPTMIVYIGDAPEDKKKGKKAVEEETEEEEEEQEECCIIKAVKQPAATLIDRWCT